MSTSVNLTTPVGRLVQGSLYKGQTQDAEGKPLVNKTGAATGQPRVDYFFALAIPKGTETRWATTEWGKLIWQVGHESFPQGQAQHPTFAWKITDGDSAVPNKRGRKPCDREGYPGNWVLSFSSGYAPRVFNANGTAPITEPDAVKLGYYIQVAATIAGNGSQSQPGVYLNHNMVAFAAYGPEIILGPDPAAAGFGQAPLPAGASAAPIGALGAGAPPPPAAAVAAPLGVTGPQYQSPAAPVAPPPAPPVQPNPAFVAGLPDRTMLPAAGGATYDQMKAAGWTDALLVQHGMMAA